LSAQNFTDEEGKCFQNACYRKVTYICILIIIHWIVVYSLRHWKPILYALNNLTLNKDIKSNRKNKNCVMTWEQCFVPLGRQQCPIQKILDSCYDLQFLSFAGVSSQELVWQNLGWFQRMNVVPQNPWIRVLEEPEWFSYAIPRVLRKVAIYTYKRSNVCLYI
jgi:hypothetical protein